MDRMAPSPRFKDVVGKAGEIIFDPHPSREGLSGDPDDWEIDIFIKKFNE